MLILILIDVQYSQRATLERLYLKDNKSLAYIAYEKFGSFQRPTEMNIIDYINEFEQLYYEIQLFQQLYQHIVFLKVQTCQMRSNSKSYNNRVKLQKYEKKS